MTMSGREIVGTPQLALQWARIQARLQAEVGEVEYRTWLRTMTLAGLDGDELTHHLPTRFLRDWVRKHYGDRLNTLWQAENPAIRRVEIRVAGVNGTTGPVPVETAVAASDEPAKAPARAQDPFEPHPELAAALDPRFTFDAFVVGKSNEFAHACARRVAESPASAGFTPFFLYGGVGLGKTHLMHAITAELTKTARKPLAIAYMSAEKFMYRFIAAIRANTTMDFKAQVRGLDILLIDDLQFLIGKDNTQEEFFHTFNYLTEAGKQIVMSADRAPTALSGLDDRLRTRLGSGIVADLQVSTYELRLAILAAKAEQAGVDVPRQVMEFLAHKVTANNRELEGAINRVMVHARLFNRPITLESTHDVLHDVLKTVDRKITIEEIQKRVAEHFGLKLSDMASARRARAVARPRQVAMYLAKQLTSRSLPEIGRKFGNRDHTTVMHAVSRINELSQADQSFAEDVELLRRMLEAG